MNKYSIAYITISVVLVSLLNACDLCTAMRSSVDSKKPSMQIPRKTKNGSKAVIL